MHAAPGAAGRDQLLVGQPDWEYGDFMAQHLQAYLRMSAEFMQEFYAQQQQRQQ
jgi:hypothetical protein